MAVCAEKTESIGNAVANIQGYIMKLRKSGELEDQHYVYLCQQLKRISECSVLHIEVRHLQEGIEQLRKENNNG